MIHSIDHVRPEERDQMFADIEQMICRVNKGVQRFEKLHLNAERSLFGLRNRKVLEEFGAYLNTALEIAEEVTSRVSTFTQDLEYAKCYGQLFRCNDNHYGTYDYSEDAGQVYDDEHDNCDNTGIESTQQMLHYFDEHNQELYKQEQEQQQEQEQEQEQQQQQQQQQQQSESSSALNSVYHEEAVIIEGQEDAVNGSETTTETVVKETQQKKKGGWLWF
jgi:hypothetical protein